MKKLLFLFLILTIFLVLIYTDLINFNTVIDSKTNEQNFEVDSTNIYDSNLKESIYIPSVHSEQSSVNEFPIIKRAVLYRNGVVEEIQPNDSRITQMINYIMCSIEEKNYGWVKGMLDKSSIERYYVPKTGIHLVLDIDSLNSIEFNGYNRAVISDSDVIMIDTTNLVDDEGTPYNYCFTPYYEKYGGYENVPDILIACGF